MIGQAEIWPQQIESRSLRPTSTPACALSKLGSRKGRFLSAWFHNTIRRHSTFGYLSPAEFEKKGG